MMLAREPKTQIAGITLLGDMEDMTRKHAPGNWTEVKVYATFMRVSEKLFFMCIRSDGKIEILFYSATKSKFCGQLLTIFNI